MTVMMFGMTGAGKSALGNLMAGHDFFTSGNDSASVTKKQSVMRYEAPDESLVVLDTIGLGDTTLDQEKVVQSICDSALSAPNGVDAVFFVLKFGRITDEMIARLIYVTQYLWGSECLLNLYVIVTHAPKYVRDRKEAEVWINRQNEINWRFRHIFSLVGNNSNRIIFVDNPDPEDGEPFASVRVGVSRQNIFRVLLKHPREAIPPFTHQMMLKARELTEATWHQVQRAEDKVQHLQVEAAASVINPEEAIVAVTGGQPSEHQLSCKPDLPTQLLEARQQKREAEKAWQDELEKVRDTEEFQQAAVEIVEEANKAFETVETGCEEATLQAQVEGLVEATKQPANTNAQAVTKVTKSGGPFKAMKRMMMSVKTQVTQVARPRQGSKAAKQPAKAKVQTRDDIERAVDEVLLALIKGIHESPLRVFQKLDAQAIGFLPPAAFNNFMNEVVHSPSRIQLAGLWRRADANGDGFLDQSEFCKLLAPPGENRMLLGTYFDTTDNEWKLQKQA